MRSVIVLGMMAVLCVSLGACSGGDLKALPLNGRTGVLEGFGSPVAVALDGHGVLYVAEAASGQVVCVFADGQRIPQHVGLPQASGLVVDRLGRVYLSDEASGQVLRLELDGTRNVLASGLAGPAGLVLDRDGGLYVACRGDGTVRRVVAN